MVNQSIRRQVTKRSVSPSARGGWGQGSPSIVELAIRLLVPSRRAGWGPYSAPTFSMHARSDFLLLGAAALFEGKWLHVEHDTRGLIDQYFPSGPRPEELHFALLRQGDRQLKVY